MAEKIKSRKPLMKATAKQEESIYPNIEENAEGNFNITGPGGDKTKLDVIGISWGDKLMRNYEVEETPTPQPEYTITVINSTATTETTQITTVNHEATLEADPVTAYSFTAPSGETFASYNSATDGSGTTYAACTAIVFSANTTIYALWQ